MNDPTISLYALAYWATLLFTVIGAALGLAGVWSKDFWKNDIAPKLLMTDFIFAGTSLVVAIITKFLGG